MDLASMHREQDRPERIEEGEQYVMWGNALCKVLQTTKIVYVHEYPESEFAIYRRVI